MVRLYNPGQEGNGILIVGIAGKEKSGKTIGGILKFKFGIPGSPMSKEMFKEIIGMAGKEISGIVIGGIEKLREGNPGIPISREMFKLIVGIAGKEISGKVIGGIEKAGKSQAPILSCCFYRG